MKRKFSKILGVGLTLALLASLLLVAAPVSAAVSQPAVTLSEANAKVGEAGDYSIVFTTTEDLVAGDTITVVFPDGTDLADPGYDSTPGQVTVTGQTTPASIAQGQRVNITLSHDIAADTEVTVAFAVANDVINPADVGIYQLQVYTSTETTAKTSAEYNIYAATSSDMAAPSNIALDPVAAVAGATTEYTITVAADADAVLAGGSTLTFEFPAGTDVSVITGATFDGNDTATPSVSEQEVTIILPDGKYLDTNSKDVAISGVVNPTEALDGTYKIRVKSNIETEWSAFSGTYDIVVGDVSQLAFTASPSLIAPDEVATFTVQTQDEYGNDNTLDNASYVVPDTTSSTGTFWVNAGPPPTTPITSAGIALSSGTITFFYTDTTAGDYTITVTEETPSTPPWTDATTSLSVNVALEVGLYHDGALVAYYHTIGDAVAAAVAGDTIEVGPGTYVENSIDINKADLTLESTADATTTIIDVTGGSIVISADDVTIDGFTVENVADGGRGIEVTGNAATLKYNVITLENPATGWADGIWIGFVVGATVEYNELASEVTLTVGTSTNVTLFDNVFGGGINLDDVQDIDIIDNDLLNVNYDGIRFNNGPFEDILIRGNTISGTTATTNPNNAGIGFRLGGDVSVTNLQIIGNYITDNDGPGIVIPDTVTLAGTNVIKYNDISGNGGYGIQNDTATTDLDAKYNWWGDVTGPTYTALTGASITTSNPNGIGDAISDQVTYYPWLHKSLADVMAANASYPTFSVSLSVGWNTLSVPAKLIAGADTLGEMLPSNSWSVVWKYDTGDWELVLTNDVINPLDAIYIKMTSVQTVLLKVDGAALSAPTKSLAAGWNLVGLASLATKADLLVEDLLPSASFGQLVSPSMNAGDPWALISDGSTQGILAIGEGYWLFMKSAATMAAFDVLPLVPDFN